MASEARIDIYASDKASATVKSVQGHLQGLAAEAKKSILTGVGLAGGVAAFQLLSNAVRGAVDFMGDAVTAAQADEVSVAQLTTALQENVRAWDGNIAAIEDTIAARMKLGFTDEEQRASLGVLVAMTQDHTAALAINRVAMDLARLKNIDLASASTILGKAYNGNVVALQRMGIQVTAGTKGMEVLGAVSERVAGQAEAFADTSTGAAAAATIAFEELQEEIGRELLPVVTELAKFARDDLVPALRTVLDATKAVADAMPELDIAMVPVIGDLIALAGAFGDVGDAAERGPYDARTFAAGVKSALEDGASGVTAGANAMAHGIQEAARNARQDAVREMRALPGDIAKALRDGSHDVDAAMEQLTEDMANELDDAVRLAYLKGLLVSDAIVNGLVDTRDVVQAQTQETVRLILAEIEQIESGAGQIAIDAGVSLANGLRMAQAPALAAAHDIARGIRGNLASIDAQSIGWNVINSYAAGIYSAGYLAEQAAQWVKNKVSGVLAHAGSPWYTGSRKIGEMVAKTYGEGLSKGLSGLPDLGGFLGGTGIREGGGFAAGVAPAGDIHTHVYLDGREIAESVTRHQYYMAPTTALYPKG